MTQVANKELWSVFDARRVKAPELRGLDAVANGVIGWFQNRRPVLMHLKTQVKRINALEPEIQNLSSARFKEEVSAVQELARRNKLVGAPMDRAMALVREGAK